MTTNFWRKLGDIPSFVVLAFRSKMQYRNSDFKRLNGNNPATSCTNLVSFRPIPWSLRCFSSSLNFAATRLQFDNRSLLGTLAYPKRIEISQFQFQNSNQQSFLYIVWKFGEIQISDRSLRRSKKLYSRENFLGWLKLRSLRGGGLLATAAISNWLFH